MHPHSDRKRGSPSWDPLDEEGPGPDGPGRDRGWVGSEHVCGGGCEIRVLGGVGAALPGGREPWRGSALPCVQDGGCPVLSKPELLSCVGLTLNTEMPHFKCRC